MQERRAPTTAKVQAMIDAAGSAMIATGNYTGDGTDNRQITVGFKCSFVYVYRRTTMCWLAHTVNNCVKLTFAPSLIFSGADCLLHGTDGFIVDNLDANTNASVYDYWAISEIDASGGGANVKSGTIAASGGSNSVTFNTAFASTPQVVLTVQDASLVLRDAIYVVRSVSITGFTFEADAAATYAWVATDAGDS